MNFSILIPTRNRSKSVQEFLCSFCITISSIDKVELFFLFDKDDKKSYEELNNISISHPNIHYEFREKSDYLNRDYYNYLAAKTNNKYLWAVGDDVRFLTKNWDKILEGKIEEYLKDKSDRIAYIHVAEEGSKAAHACFPLITQEAFNFLGMYFHPELMSWGADRCLWELYSGVDRTLYVPEVKIEHLTYHDNKAEFDNTAASMRERFFRDPNCHNKVSASIIPNQTKILKEYINERMVKSI